MSESIDLTYYQRNKERLKKQARDKYRNVSEEEKMKRENMGKIDTIICLRKETKTKRIPKKIIVKQKSLNIKNDLIVYNND